MLSMSEVWFLDVCCSNLHDSDNVRISNSPFPSSLLTKLISHVFHDEIGVRVELS